MKKLSGNGESIDCNLYLISWKIKQYECDRFHEEMNARGSATYILIFQELYEIVEGFWKFSFMHWKRTLLNSLVRKGLLWLKHPFGKAYLRLENNLGMKNTVNNVEFKCAKLWTLDDTILRKNSEGKVFFKWWTIDF